MSKHIFFTCVPGGCIHVKRICTNYLNIEHTYELPIKASRILGIPTTAILKAEDDFKILGETPASLSNGLPNMLVVYTDICESYITGDVQSSLLRIIPIDTENYPYGSIKTRSFSPGKYIPRLHTNFQTIEIDIRDHLGNPVPFENGSLTVMLHFKCFDS